MAKTSRIPPQRESKIQASIKTRLARLGVHLWRRNVGALTDTRGNHVRFAAPGQADLWGVDRRGIHWEIECKRPGNKPTPKQLAWLREMTARGCVAFWSDSADVAEYVAKAVLEGGRIVWRGDGCDFDVWITRPETPSRQAGATEPPGVLPRGCNE